MDGLNGRMLRMPSSSSKKQEILLIGGHHTCIERMFSLAEVLSRYGAVTMPDLPGFGGMEPFYKIGIKPSIDSFADYLAAFIKLRYKKKKVIVIGFSYSVPVVVKMLQKYPELAKKVEFVVSIVGFVHKEDFMLPKNKILGLRVLSALGSNSVAAFLAKYLIVREFIIRMLYKVQVNSHSKMKDAKPDEIKDRIDFEVKLWMLNDLRTWFETMGEMFHIDLCGQKVNVQMHHVMPKSDVYFDHRVVEQHMKIIFDDVQVYSTGLPNHVPSIVATAEEIEPFFPKKLQKNFARL